MSANALVEQINQLRKRPDNKPLCQWMGGIFYIILPEEAKDLSLKKIYKPSQFSGAGTIANLRIRTYNEALRIAEAKLIEKGFYGERYFNDDSSFKLHLNLNDIGEIDESVIIGLIQLLTDESESPENNMNFHFKIIDPRSSQDARFRNTDQITVYFDKYSSLGDVVKLTKKVQSYLEKQIPENKIKTGPKDSISFNSFVSGRFDHDKISNKYNVFKFFDLELAKFFKAHEKDDLSDVPLFALEAVFNSLILSQELKLDAQTGELHPDESSQIQAEFNEVLMDPFIYVKKIIDQHASPQLMPNQKFGKHSNIMTTIFEINELRPDFSSCKNEDELMKTYRKICGTLNQYVREIDLELSLDRDILETASLLIKERQNEIDSSCHQQRLTFKENQQILASMKKMHEFLGDLNAQIHLLTAKSNQAKAQVAMELYQTLVNELKLLEPDFYKIEVVERFKKQCTSAINNSKKNLLKHSGLDDILLDATLAIATLGIPHAVNYHKSKGQNVFFNKSNLTKQVEKLEDTVLNISKSPFSKK